MRSRHVRSRIRIVRPRDQQAGFYPGNIDSPLPAELNAKWLTGLHHYIPNAGSIVSGNEQFVAQFPGESLPGELNVDAANGGPGSTREVEILPVRPCCGVDHISRPWALNHEDSVVIRFISNLYIEAFGL